MGGERRERHRLGCAELEPRGHETDEVFVAEVLDNESRVRHRLGHDCARELAVGHFHREPLRRTFGEPQRERGRDAPHLDDERGHQRPAHGSDHAERGVPGLETLEHRQVLAERAELAADRPRPVEHAGPELGGHRSPPAPDEELYAQLRFQLLDVARHVGLHRVEAVGRRRERAFLGDREQRFELAQVHPATLLIRVHRCER